MEHFLIALDDTPGSLKSIDYVCRLLRGNQYVQMTLFHVLPTASPDMLKREEVRRIELLQAERPHLSGYFWEEDDERKMNGVFEKARQLLLQSEFRESQIGTHFSVQSAEVAQVILGEAKSLKCSTIVMGRRGKGRVKEFFLGSVSTSVTKLARGLTVWVVDD